MVWGKAGSGPPLVFCHGTPWSSIVWQPFAAALSAEFTVYLWDMPGYGLSSKDSEHPVDLAVQGELLTDEEQAAFYRQIAQADEALTAEFEPLLGDVAAPTRIIWGTDDTWIPADRAGRLSRSIPGATVSLVPGAGHLIQYDAPATLATELRKWLGP